MTTVALSRADRFHGYLDAELAIDPGPATPAGPSTASRHFIIQERDVRYRFHLHQHPYVQQLMQRLIRAGASGLQAADTQHGAEGESLPGSVRIAAESSVALTLPAGSRIALLATVQATSGGSAIELAAHLAFPIASDATAMSNDGLSATLLDGLTATPSIGDVFEPAPNSRAVLSTDTRIVLTAASAVVLHDGTAATLPAGTEVIVTANTRVDLPTGLQVKLVASTPRPVLFADFFDAAYLPNATMLQQPSPVKDLDFSSGGAYSVYNWELFFHVPLTIAMHLSKNQRFAEAQRWFHYLFDPTDDSNGPTPQRYWKVRPFQTTDVRQVEQLLINLATGADETLRADTIRSMEAWKDAPFSPHVIARYRQQAYMLKTVMAYLDNLIAWGDSLFRQDTGEAIDEAMMVYVLAANILGPRPLRVPRKGSVRRQTYANLRQDLQEFGTVLRDVEADLPFDLMPFPADDGATNDRAATLRSIGNALYFCVPPNDKLVGYWDTIADRLFKIRNSLNFHGVFRQLALFEPPIDPAMLARAAASGLDVAAIVNGLNQPLPLVRFQLLVQKAADICQEVKSLGNSLLAAMEKEDGEALAILRARHERIVMEMAEQVRYGQLQEAIKSREALLQSLTMAIQRYAFFERQLGKKAEEIESAIPEFDTLDAASLTRMRFAMNEPQIAMRDIDIDIAGDLEDAGGKMVSSYEAEELAKSGLALNVHRAAKLLQLTAQSLTMIPNYTAHGHYWGIGGSIEMGGAKFAAVAELGSHLGFAAAEELNSEAAQSARVGTYARREQEWAFQSNVAAGDIGQIFKQIRAAEIREAVAGMELRNHRQQMKHAEEIEDFLNEDGTPAGKKTNKNLYAWMKREVKGLYSQCFQFAFDVAKKAERALQHELGATDASFLQFGYLAGNEGLLAGEKLYFDVKRMEMAYHDLNHREYELTKHVSVLQLNPLAVLQLRATGRCTVELPEVLFDMDGPGHYFRRLKTVAVSIPCVTGPLASVNCTLTLLKSSVRKTPALGDTPYSRENADDPRFADYFGSLQSIVTSSAQHDAGLFQADMRDERYLPFENSGAISEWQLELPANPANNEVRQFDYRTISDVILHVRYTAREGGTPLRKAAMQEVGAAIERAEMAGSVRLFSVRDEFPSEWARFQSQVPTPNNRFELKLSLGEQHYPFWSRGHLQTVRDVQLTARSAAVPAASSLDVFDRSDRNDPAAKKDILAQDQSAGKQLVGRLANIERPASPLGDLTLFFDDKQIADLWIAVKWGGQ